MGSDEVVEIWGLERTTEPVLGEADIDEEVDIIEDADVDRTAGRLEIDDAVEHDVGDKAVNDDDEAEQFQLRELMVSNATSTTKQVAQSSSGTSTVFHHWDRIALHERYFSPS